MRFQVNNEKFATEVAALAYARKIAGGMAVDICRDGVPVRRVYGWTAFRG